MKLTCHKCKPLQYCATGRKNRKRPACPLNAAPEVLARARALYEENEEIRATTNVASVVEAKGYLQWPRLKDTIEYAKGRGYTKLGLAFCVGMIHEVRKIAEILTRYGFEVNAVCCKTGCLTKQELGVPEEFTMRSKTGYLIGWISCNPVGQALLLNEAGTDMNIIVGLCVGHDITFTRLSEAPVTTLVAKDRMTGHSPAAVLFSYYGETFFNEDFKACREQERERESERGEG